MKKYENPMLQVVSIKKNDIVTASPNNITDEYHEGWKTLAPGVRDYNIWYEGY